MNHIIETRDKSRQENFKNMFWVDDSDSPGMYDFVINTTKLSEADSVNMGLNLVELKQVLGNTLYD